jgi:RimJ/RimL family protein N-acetyltransferase
MSIEPITLTGDLVRLEPLQLSHAPALYEAAQDQTIWTWYQENPSGSLAVMERSISNALEAQEAGKQLPFAIIELSTGHVVGSTRFYEIDLDNRGMEIGATWLNPAIQRTGVNTECKYLLLQYAFEVFGAIRVQLKTHHNNLKSQRAIERLGAVKEGILRNAKIYPDGSYRHSVYYSILDTEWPQVKANLEAKMQSK